MISACWKVIRSVKPAPWSEEEKKVTSVELEDRGFSRQAASKREATEKEERGDGRLAESPASAGTSSFKETWDGLLEQGKPCSERVRREKSTRRTIFHLVRYVSLGQCPSSRALQEQ